MEVVENQQTQNEEENTVRVCTTGEQLSAREVELVPLEPPEQDIRVATNQPSINQTPSEIEQNLQTLPLELEMIRQEETKRQVKRQSEIDAAVRCLTTNLLLFSAFFIFIYLEPMLNSMFVMVMTALMKAHIPIIATVSNFVKIHTLLIETFIKCKNSEQTQAQ